MVAGRNVSTPPCGTIADGTYMPGREAVWEEACCLVIGCGRVHQLVAMDPMRKWYKNHLHHESVSCCAWLTEHWWGDKPNCIDSFYDLLYVCTFVLGVRLNSLNLGIDICNMF